MRDVVLKLYRNRTSFGIVATIIISGIITAVTVLIHYYSIPYRHIPFREDYIVIATIILITLGSFGVPFIVIGLKHHLRKKYHAKAIVVGKYIDKETTFLNGTDFEIRHRMVTFEIDNGTAWSFGLTKKEYRKLQVGDKGTLTYGLQYNEELDGNGKLFKSFKKH